MYMPVMDGKTVRNMPNKGSGWIVGRAVDYVGNTVKISGDAHVYDKRTSQTTVNVIKWGDVYGVWSFSDDTKCPFPVDCGKAVVE